MLMWNADASNGPRAARRASDSRTKLNGDQRSQAWRQTQQTGETSVQLQSTNAQTPPKTEEYQRPESKTIQQLAEPDEICKTSTPGSNPGGASNFPEHFSGSRLAGQPEVSTEYAHLDLS